MGITRKNLLSFLIPLSLLGLFGLILRFPSLVPRPDYRVKASEGLETTVITVPGCGVSLVLKKVPSGTAPGGSLDEEGALRVESPLWLAETETRVSLFRSVAAKADEYGYDLGPLPGGVSPGDDYPQEGVSWIQAVLWCNLLSELCGLEPAYLGSGSGEEPLRSVAEALSLCLLDPDAPRIRPGAKGFRLPMSAEWEFAARYVDGLAWTSGTWPSGGTASWTEQSRADMVAVYERESNSPAGSLAPNALGLYDMSGSVWEWCYDAFSGSTPLKRTVRGGSWIGRGWRIQIGGSFGTLPDAVEGGQGFRVALGTE